MDKYKRNTTKRAPAPEDLVEFFDCEQGSEAWHDLHRGVPSASKFATIMADGKDGGPSLTRGRLMDQMAAEIISGLRAETYSSRAMERGLEQEPALIEHYAFTRGVSVERVGFIRRTIANPLGEDLVIGCSPDGLVGADGLVQTKSLQPDLLIRLVDDGRFPAKHKWQCHGEIWVSGRQWCDLRIGYAGMPIDATFRITRDDLLIDELKAGVEKFSWELKKLIERVKQKGRIR